MLLDATISAKTKRHKEASSGHVTVSGGCVSYPVNEFASHSASDTPSHIAESQPSSSSVIHTALSPYVSLQDKSNVNFSQQFHDNVLQVSLRQQEGTALFISCLLY